MPPHTPPDLPSPARSLQALFLALPALWALGNFWPPLNHDVAAVLDVSRRWIEGERLYRDVIDINTPLVFMIHAIPAGLAKLLGGGGTTWMVALTLASIAASTLACRRMLRRLRDEGQAMGGTALFLAIPFALAVAPPEGSFGQREHLMLILALPYALACAVRADGRDLPRGAALLAGLAAGVGFGMKPHFLLIPAALELYVAVALGPRRSLASPAPWAVAGVALAHGAFVLLATPDYVEVALPLALEFYGQLGQTSALGVLTGRIVAPCLVGLLGAAGVAAWCRRPRAATALAVLGLGAVLAAVLQGKGWPYQTYPVLAATMLALVAALSGALDRWGSAVSARPGLPTTLVACTVVGILYVNAAMMDLPFGKQRYYATSEVARLIPVVRQHAPDGRVMALSPGIYPHWPVVNYAGATMTMRFLTMWPIQGAYVRCPESGKPYREPAEMSEGERFAFEAVVADFVGGRPSVLIVDQTPGILDCGRVRFDYLDYFGRHPRFAEAFRGYRKVMDLDRYAIYGRAD